MATRAGPGHASCSFCRRLRSEGDLSRDIPMIDDHPQRMRRSGSSAHRRVVLSGAFILSKAAKRPQETTGQTRI